MKAFVTGGTGFIGRYLVRALVNRGYEVCALARSENGMDLLQSFGALPVAGDINTIDSMREGMQGSDVVFHVAGWYKLGARDWKEAEKINVEGTRNVLNLAFELGIPRIVYTSTVGVFGDTHGRLVDETYVMPPEQEFLTEYDRTKWLAHYQVALPLIMKGAPVIIVMPGLVYGPGDHSLVAEMMRWFYRGWFPIFPAPQLTLTYAHVEDIVEGHILAAEKGNPGESYILTGPVYSMGEMAKLWHRLTGRREPLFSIPAVFLKPFTPVMELAGRIIPLPELLSRDSLAILDATYMANSAKARMELGWRTRTVEEGMRETMAWIAETEKPSAPSYREQKKAIAALSLALGVTLLVTWLLNRRK
jgi:nucleoside-diphosphate-sugar epimerase